MVKHKFEEMGINMDAKKSFDGTQEKKTEFHGGRNRKPNSEQPK